MGDPQEHFNTQFMIAMASKTPSCVADLDTYVRAAICEPSLRNGVIASKLFWFQLEAARKKLAPDLSISLAFDRLLRLCGDLRIIRLIRRDKIRQAISYISAYQTGVWSVSREDRIRSRPLDSHQFPEIDRWSRKFLEWEQLWDDLLAQQRSEVVTIRYEEIMNSIEEGARTVATRMGVDLCPSFIGTLRSAVVKQSDQESVDRTVAAFKRWQACLG
jgi:LPS sulfotransferase NodH